MQAAPAFTLGDLARRWKLPLWKVRRPYELKLLPDPPRAGCYRRVTERDLPALEAALRRLGYLPAQEEGTHAVA